MQNGSTDVAFWCQNLHHVPKSELQQFLSPHKRFVGSASDGLAYNSFIIFQEGPGAPPQSCHLPLRVHPISVPLPLHLVLRGVPCPKTPCHGLGVACSHLQKTCVAPFLCASSVGGKSLHAN